MGEGKTWPFHLVMFFTTTASIGLLIVYIIFVSGYHRRRKRKPWPTYELYFNVWLVIWFLAAALTESCHAWRFNYGPYLATHVFVCVCLWVCFVLSVVATWHAYMLNQVYLKILSGANFDEKSGKQSLNQGYMAAIKKKFNRANTASGASTKTGKTGKSRTTITSARTKSEVSKSVPPASRADETLNSTNFEPKRTSTKSDKKPKKPKP